MSSDTMLTIKTPEKLRDEAKKTAQKLDMPLTTVINALLKDFVREQAITVSARPTPRPEKLAEWRRMSDDMDKHPEKNTVYNSMEEYLAYLEKGP